MIKSRRSVVCFLTMCIAATATATVAKDVLDLIPADALGFAVVNRIGETDIKVQKLGRQMDLPIPSPLTLFKLQSGIQKGIDEKSALAVALVPAADAQLAGVFFVPVTDFEEFVSQLSPEETTKRIKQVRIADTPLLVARKRGYALMAWPKDQQALRRVMRAKESIAAAVAQTRQYLDEQDAAAMVMSSGVTVLTALGQHGLEQAKDAVKELGDPKNPAVAAIDLYAKMLRAIGVEVKSFAWGIKHDESGVLRVTSRCQFNPSGAMAPLLREAKPYEGDLLAGLPAVPYVIAFGAVLPPEMHESVMEISGNIMKAAPQLYGLEPEQVDTMIQLSKKTLAGLRGMSFVMGAGQPGDPLYSELLGVFHVDDADAYLENYTEYFQELDKALEGIDKESFLANMELEEIEADGLSALKLTMGSWGAIAAGVPDPEEFEQMMEKMFGPGGKLVAYLAAADKHEVLMNYTNTNLIPIAIECIKSGQNTLSHDVTKAAELLPSGAQAIGCISPSGMIVFINRMAAMIPDVPGPPNLPEFPETPPAGWAAKASPQGLETELVVPAELLSAIGKYVISIQKWQAERKTARGTGAVPEED